MNRKILATAICAGLFMTGGAWAQDNSAQPQDQSASAQPQDKQEKKTLQAVVVTGSLIPQAEIETASPVITITSKDIETQGFKNVYDALKSQPVSTGSVQDSQFTNGFTPGANTISLFGLDPGFTLILINGHPLADYPLPYNGTGNFVDLATIPTSVVDHIDILSGGQSSLYGSSAIAGVINIVLKKHMEGVDLSFRGGGYSEGGGQNERFTLSGGNTVGKLDINYALQLDNQNPIWASQRSFMDSYLDAPNGDGAASRNFLLASAFGTPDGNYIDPGAAQCDPLHYLDGGTVNYNYRAGHGYYCGSYDQPGYATILNENKSANGFLNLNYHLNDNTELYSEILYSYSKPKFSSGPYLFTYYNPALANSGNAYAQYFWANNAKQNPFGYYGIPGDLELAQRIFTPEEVGGRGGAMTTVITKQYNANFGIRGNFGQSDWGYDAYYNRSQVSTSSSQRWPLNKPMQDWYLGQQLPGSDPLGYGFPVYNINYDHFYTPLTVAQYDAMSDFVKSQSISWQQNATAVFTNTNLFNLPAGPAGFAGVIQYGNQAFNNPVDPRLANGEFVGLTGTAGSGSRKHGAIGAELRVPLFSMLTADASARYDRYDSGFRTDAKPTYKLGLEFRPWDSLLLRATYATAFRAPDMEFLFAKNSGFYTTGTDYTLCREQNPGVTSFGECNSYAESVFGRNNGNPDLNDVNSKSFGYGAVWSPTHNFNVKVDYQHIKIDNEIRTQSINDLLETESNCQLGTSFGGQVFDPTSPTCVDAFSRVIRYPADYPFGLAANTIQYLSVGPVNIASETVNGIQASLDYRLDAGRFGDFVFNAAYYDELNHTFTNKPGDPEIDLLHNYNSYEFKTIGNGTVTWNIGPWSTTLHATRYGRTVNFSFSGTTSPQILYNANIRYSLADDNAYIQLTANNLFDKKPPIDPSTGYPYYNFLNWNAYGRSVFLEMGVHLGPGKSGQ